MTRPAPPKGFEENPPLGTDFFARARPARPGEAARLRRALEAIVHADDVDDPVGVPIAEARRLLMDL